MNSTLHISQLASEEIEEMADLVNSAYRGESSKKGWTTEAGLLDGIRTSKASIQDLAKVPGAMILIARNKDGRMAGCVHLQQQHELMYIGMLTVAPDLQAEGMGKKILHAAETYARETRCTGTIMTVIDIRHELIAWYQRHGYQSTGETQPFPAGHAFGIPRQPLRFIVLQKTL